MAHWFGTLAAVRALGRRGIEVHVAASGPLQQAAWSRYAVRRLSSPPAYDASAHIRWLIETGRRNRGAVLCAASDDLCFLYAAHERELRQYFQLATASLDTLRELLDKERLYRNAQRHGLKTPVTLFPADAEEAQKLGAKARFPQLFKLRTQVLSRTLHKGTPVTRPDDLVNAHQRFRSDNPFDPELLTRWPDADRPLLQEYLPLSAQRIYCIEGFIAPGGERWATRAVFKVLSHPRYLGIGLLFEHAEPVADLEQRIVRLCRSLGYVGVFQCEFIEHEGAHLLIDFNPRFYNYMAFDHARGLPQAYLAYLHALGANDELNAEIDRAQQVPPHLENLVYCYHLGTWTQLLIERLFRRIPADESKRWRGWHRAATGLVDPAWEPGDPGPGQADVLSQIWSAIRHPRSFLRGNTRRAL
jgi:predicted ATP-grasp superfamily ATP-dependent carboligase